MLGMYLARCREWSRIALVSIAASSMFIAAAGRVESLDTAASVEDPAAVDSTDIDISALGKPPSGSGAPANLVVTALSRFVVKAVWEDKSSDETSFYVYRGTSSGSYDTLKNLPANSVVYCDTAVTAGATYYYKVCNASGCTAEVSVTVPTAVDTTLSLLPSFVTTWPGGFANTIDSRAQVAITLQPEDPGVDLTGSTVELFVDEPTQEEGLSTGEASTHEPGLGRDEVACLSRAAVPAQAVTVGAPGPFTLTVADLRAGQHAFRLRITDTLGTSRERAFLRHVPRPDAVYGDLVWVGSGNVTKSKRPVLFGYGPPSRYSPDCQDLDDRYYTVVEYKVTDKQGTVWI